MKTKEIEIVTKKTVYEANDGTIFYDSCECEKYDKTAIGVLKSRIKNFLVNSGTEYELFGCGCDDNRCWVVLPKTTEDISLIKQLLLMYGHCIEDVERVGETDVNKYFILTWSYDGTDMWYMKLDNLIINITGKDF